MPELTNLIDATTFGTVRRYLRAAHSPITTVMLVQHRETLERAGAALLEDQGTARTFRTRQWAHWLRTGEVRLGGAVANGVDLDAIPDSATCDVLFLPPVYLVCLRGYKLCVPRQAAA